MTVQPGSIKVSKEAVYALLTDLDAKIVKHIEQWRDAVPAGTTVTIAEMLTGQYQGPGGALMLTPCATGMPLEIVRDHLLPPDGSPCAIDGITVLAVQGPLLEVALGRPMMIKKEV